MWLPWLTFLPPNNGLGIFSFIVLTDADLSFRFLRQRLFLDTSVQSCRLVEDAKPLSVCLSAVVVIVCLLPVETCML